MTSERGNAACSSGPPLTERRRGGAGARDRLQDRPAGRVGVELEWLVCDGRDPALPVDQRRVAAALARLDEPGALPGRGRLTTEPGGQVELSSAPASGLGGCVAAARSDLTAVRQAIAPGGSQPRRAGPRSSPTPAPRPRPSALRGDGRVLRPQRPLGPGHDVQHRLRPGVRGRRAVSRAAPSGFRWRWHLLHGLGPVLVAAFANSPFQDGRMSGWKSTRQAVWSRLDPSRTRAPEEAEPARPTAARPGRRTPIPGPPG